MHELTPQKIVAELDQYIIGQGPAKRAVAVAIRNRWRRRQLDPEMAREVYPKNIVMVGPTGVGKTEIARRLAKLTGAPFVKVEASKFTEVGYHGRDVESMVRDLLDVAMSMVRSEQAEQVQEKAASAAEERLLDLLLPGPTEAQSLEQDDNGDSLAERRHRAREKLRQQLAAGNLEDREVETVVTHKPAVSMMFANMGLTQMDPAMASMFERIVPEESKRTRLSVSEARHLYLEEETEKLIDQEKLTSEAISRTEESGIIFIDEIDKIATPVDQGGRAGGPDVSRQGVQRDLLPIVEGSAVSTRYGLVHTDHTLFIAAGAFHSASVSDLMPELQGRFPIRVELAALNRDDFVRILTEPSNALTKQEKALLKVEGLKVTFKTEAIDAIADMAAEANARLENIGARRLVTIMEKVFEQINFEAPQRAAAGDTNVIITDNFVRKQVASILEDQDLSKFVL